MLIFQAKCQANKTTEEKDLVRQKDSEDRAKRRANMTEEEREAQKEKDRLRKRKKKNLDWRSCSSNFNAGVASQPSVPHVRAARPRIYMKNEREHNKQYKRRVRKGRTQTEIEYENVDNLLKMRDTRKARDGKHHLLDNLRAKQGMSEHGGVIGIAFMRRAKREKDEEVLWWSFWKKGKTYRDLLTLKRPEVAAVIKVKEEFLMKKEEERTKINKDLDSKGRWIYDCGEYYWSIPNENGQSKTLAEYEAECEANEPKLTPEEEAEEEKKYQKELEEWRKHDEQMLEWNIRQLKDERNRKRRETYQKKKEELSKPITMSKQTIKGDYEKARDNTILERYHAMKESGMFDENELHHMLDMIL